MKINGTSKSLALGGLIGTTVAIMYVVNAEDLDGDGFHEFVSGTGISSSQMNYNFDQVVIDFNDVNQSLDETNESLFDLDDRLGLFEGTIAIDGANVGISGSISAADLYGDGSSLTDLDATSLTTGTVATTRLGSGTADSSTFLRGDGAWAPVSGVQGNGTTNYLPLFTNGSTIGNSAIYQSNGNVGIGTTAPATKLEVSGGAARFSGYVEPASGVGVEIGYDGANGVVQTYDRSGASYRPLYLNASSLLINTAGGTGSVGIGTTNPGSSKLSIYSTGDTWTSIGSGVNAAGFIFNKAGSQKWIWLLERDTPVYGAAANDMVLFDSVYSMARVVFKQSGNVGIGTTSPGAALEVVNGLGKGIRSGYLDINSTHNSATFLAWNAVADSSTADTFTPTYSGDGNAGMAVLREGAGGYGDLTLYTLNHGVDASSKSLGSDFNKAMHWSADGNVGIGTTDPAWTLDVKGNVNASQYVLSADDGGVTNSQGTERIRWTRAGGGADSDILFLTNSIERLRVTHGGNVGIGTTSPEYELDVEGEVAATSFVTLSDRRLKWDIEPLENASEGLQCLQSVTYRWIGRNDGPPQSSQDRQIGLIAQEVEDCFPEVVFTDSKGFKSVAYDRLVVPLIENVKDQQARYTAQQAVNAAQQQKIIDLEARLARLENSSSKR